MQSDFQIALMVVLSTMLFLFLSGVILLSLLLYKRKQNAHAVEVSELHESFEKELAKVELEVREITLQTVSDEIHDNVGQTLSLVKLYLSTIQKSYSGEETKRLEIAKELVGESIKDLRLLSHVMNNEFISSKPLPDIIKLELDRLRRATVFEVEYDEIGDRYTIDPKRKIMLYRMFQESLHNAIKHSEATRIKVRLDFRQPELQLTIEDNGKGYDTTAENNQGTGILNMKRRASLINCDVDIKSCNTRGTKIAFKTQMI